MIDKFVSEHLLNKDIEVSLSKDEKFEGTVVACADKVLTIVKDGKYIFINILHVKYIIEK
ncbi:MAG: MM0924 family protein [Candidatus Helarchaeota archaeon]